MVPVTLGVLLTPVQWKRSILGVPSATLCKMLQPVASFPPPSAPCRQSGPAFLCSSHKEEESCHTMVICQAGKAQAIQFVCWDGMGRDMGWKVGSRNSHSFQGHRQALMCSPRSRTGKELMKADLQQFPNIAGEGASDRLMQRSNVKTGKKEISPQNILKTFF